MTGSQGRESLSDGMLAQDFYTCLSRYCSVKRKLGAQRNALVGIDLSDDFAIDQFFKGLRAGTAAANQQANKKGIT